MTKIADFNNRLDAHKKQLEQQEQMRLDKLNKVFAEQSRKDRERIEFRNNLLIEKKIDLSSQKQSKQGEIEMKEKRLQKFYESVKPNVESDPARMISFTQV